jgi:Cu/Ag efflux protein CusF
MIREDGTVRLRWLAFAPIAILMFAGASSPAADPPSREAVGTKSVESGQAPTAGLVKKVDKAAGKVTIRHEPLENLGMPKMTMVFRVKNPAMLDEMKEGQEIRFIADRVNGAFTVMWFEPAD